MSTRATIHFKDQHATEAIIYRHSDGYPEGLGNDLKRFLDEIRKLRDTRFSDPSYLAARWVVWDANQHREIINECNKDNPERQSNHICDFLGVGIVSQDPGDIEYRYTVTCSEGRPKIKMEKV